MPYICSYVDKKKNPTLRVKTPVLNEFPIIHFVPTSWDKESRIIKYNKKINGVFHFNSILLKSWKVYMEKKSKKHCLYKLEKHYLEWHFCPIYIEYWFAEEGDW